MQIVRGVVTWWRLVAAAIVLLAGYTVSHYVAAAPVATPTPLTTVVVVEAAPRVVVVTATPSPIAESAGIKTPTAVPATPSGATRPTATKTERPATPSPTATPAPLAADQLAVVARIPLQPPLDNWDATSDHLVWLPDGGGLLAADGDGLHRLAGPNFTPLPPALAPLPANGRDLRLAADGRQLAFVAAGDVWAADVGAGALEGETRLLALPGRTDGATGSLHLVRWLPDGRLAATASCGRGCEELLALDRAGARPLLDFGERVSPTVPLGTDFLFSPSARLLAFQTRGEPHAVIADPEGDWWFLGGWREPERLRAYDQPVAWLDETMLLSYRRSPAGPSVNGHGLNLWRWDVLANTGRFMVADVAAVSPSPDGQQLALVLLGGPSVDEGGHLVGGRWRPDEPLPAVLAVIDVARGALLRRVVLGQHPGASEPAALDGWAALRRPLWSPDGHTLLAFDGDGRPLLLDTGRSEAAPLPLLERGQPQELAWSPDGSHLGLRIGNEVWIVALTPP